MIRHFCTYFDSRFLTRGLALHQSLRQHCPEAELWVLCLDPTAYQILKRLNLSGLRPVLHDVFAAGDERLAAARLNRSMVEYYFTCTPSWVLYLLSHYPHLEMLTYVDADLFFYSDPAPLFDEMAECSVAITPHRFPPALGDYDKFGKYNVGWLSFRQDAQAIECLQSWREQCLDWCHDRVEDGKFADQKYLDAWPERFKGIAVLNHPGANLAAWNLTGVKLGRHRKAVTVDGRELIFYHFHQLKRVSPLVYHLGLEDYGVKPSSILRRDIMAPYLRLLNALQHHLQEYLPQNASAGNLRHQPQPAAPVLSNINVARRCLRQSKAIARLLMGLAGGKYVFCLGRGSCRIIC